MVRYPFVAVCHFQQNACAKGVVVVDKSITCLFPVYACRANMVGIDTIWVQYFQAA